MSAWELADFAAHIAMMAADVEAAKEVAVVRGCKLIQRKANAMLGHPLEKAPRDQAIEHVLYNFLAKLLMLLWSL